MSNQRSPAEAWALTPVHANGNRYLSGGKGLVSLPDARVPAPEQYERLHTEIERASSPSRCFVVGVTSAVYGEGKTTVAMNLANTIAQNSPNRIALVDLNLRNRDLQSRLDLSPCSGIVDMVEDGDDNLSGIIYRTEYDNLTIIPAGRRSGNPARIARSPQLADILCAVRALNEFVVVDMAPVLPVTDTRILARLVDGIVMVARAGVTPREIVARAIDVVGKDRVLGVVLNGTDTAMPKWLHRYFGGAYSDL